MFKKVLTFIFLSLSTLSFLCCSHDTTEITLLHINDTHSKHLYTVRTNQNNSTVSTNGGASQLANLIKTIKAQNPTAMAIHAGDAVTGSVFTIVYEGIESSDILNMSDFDLAVLGNHEFDFGLEGAYEILNKRNFPTIALNIFEYDTGELVVPSTFTTNINGKSIGFLGVLTSENVYADRDKEGQFIIDDEIESIRQFLETDKSIQTNDLLILVSHCGIDKDKQIAEAFPNKFDIIIGGHSHTFLEQPVVVNDTLIIQLNSYIKELGKLDLQIDRNGNITSYNYEYIPVVNVGIDDNVENYIQEKQILVDEMLGGRIATLTDLLDDSNIRNSSCKLGNLVVDTVYNQFEDMADIVFLNSGGTRSSLEAGVLTLGEMYELAPFDNTIIYFEITGKVLNDILALSAGDNFNEGGFLMLSRGVEVYINNREIENVIINGSPLEYDKTYRIITSDWIYGGGDGYSFVSENATNIQNLGFDVRDILIQKLSEIGYIDVSKLDDTDRWIF